MENLSGNQYIEGAAGEIKPGVDVYQHPRTTMSQKVSRVIRKPGISVTVEIRKLRREDIPQIMQEDGDATDEFKAYLELQLENQDKKKECSALVATCDGKILGHVFVYYKCRWGAYGNQGMPGIVDLKVFPQYRNRGIAAKLMDEAEKIALQYHNQIYLDVCLNSEYGAAQRFYVKRGYVPDGNGVYYEEKMCPVNAKCVNDEELTLCLIKRLR